jgi:hypothetical protein
MKNRGQIWFLGIVFLLAQTPVWGNSRIPRADALASIQHTSELVRSTMNSDPQAMRFYLDDGLMDSAGDDPRAIALCREVVEKSTNSASVAIATGALYRSYQLLGFGPDYNEWHLFTSSKRIQEIVDILRQAWHHPEPNVKLAAALSLSRMGGTYREEGYRYFQQLLRGNDDKYAIYKDMIYAFGTDPDTLGYFDQRIMKSTSTEDALDSLQVVGAIESWNHSWFGGPQSKIAVVFRDAMHHRIAAIQLTAAVDMSRLGKSYSREARAFFEKRLRQPLGEDDKNIAKDALIGIVRTMLDTNRAEDIALIKDATKANPQVLDFFEGEVEATWIPNRPIGREILKKWKAVLEK